jgi:hypothetical protein
VELAVLPVLTLVPDPWNVTGLLDDDFRTAGHRQERGVPVLIRTVPEGTSSPVRHYSLRVRILSVSDDDVRGPRVPLLFQAPQARTEVHAEVELLGPDGFPLGRRTVFEGVAQQGLGAEIFPLHVSYEQRVVPDEIKEGLRAEACGNLARDIVETVVDVISERESR